MHLATEQSSIKLVMAALPEQKVWAQKVMTRLRVRYGVPDGCLVLDVGSAAGSFVLACNELGYQCVGVEPWSEARETSAQLQEALNVSMDIREGQAEKLPFKDECFDVIHASSVLEHVDDLEKALSEVSRCLKPGGVFWFNSASALCPRQDEIRVFPFFGWYPLKLKRKIMAWASLKRPALVGFTATPAIHWFTPRFTRSVLGKAGFVEIADRWDLRLRDEGGFLSNLILATIRSNRVFRFIADILVSGCSYGAKKF